MATAARAVVLLSASAGLTFLTWLGAQEWPILLPLTACAFLATYLLTRYHPTLGWTAFLVPVYLYPVIFLVMRGAFVPAYHAIWLAALMGAILAGPQLLQWHLPSAWRVPLVFWALVVALAWPILAVREMSFDWATLFDFSLANSGLGGPPPVVIASMLTVTLTELMGILWFDAMFARFATADAGAYRRAVITPLAAGLLIGAALAIYQWTVDIKFLSAHQWPYYGRAAGGLLDGNAFGAALGMWSAAALSFALTSVPALFAGGIAATLVLWIAVWATGSRMALLAALVGVTIIAWTGLRGRRAGTNRKRLGAAMAVIILAAGALVALGRFGAHARFDMDPISRVTASLPEPNKEAFAKFVEFELWNRFGPFGTASVQMIKDSPVVGVGTGTFEVLFPDYAYALTDGATRAHFDNAQSWYRHRLAELGFLGSLGWIGWLVLFGAFVWKAAPARDGLTEGTGVKAGLVALAVISLVSMPTRNPFVALTFWVFAFWLVKVTSEPADTGRLAAFSRTRSAWALTWVLALAFAGGTAWVAHAQLQPPYRAIMADWNYVKGVSRPIRTPEGIRRYAGEHGVAVFAARPGFLRLVFQVPHDDASTNPVRVRIFERNRLQANLQISDRDEHEIYVRVPEGQDRMMIQTHVSRVVPASNGLPSRGLVLHNWTFVRQPPPGALIGGEISVRR